MSEPATTPRASSALGARIAAELRPRQLLASLAAGMITGLLATLIQISLAVLIFSGTLAEHAASGMGLTLFGTCALALIVGLGSSWPGAVAVSQDLTAVLVAIAAAGIVASIPADRGADARYATVVAAIGLTSLLTAVFFWALGHFRLGGLIRFLPYPVIGGFLAGTGWLLARGGVGVMFGATPTLAELPSLFAPRALGQCLPGLIFALVLLVALRRFKHFLVLPGLFVAAVGLFYALLWLTGTSIAEARANGWLLDRFPQSALWTPPTPALLSQVYWPAILGQLDKIALVLILGAVGLLLNASGLELATGQDLDLNRELRATGVANAVAGLGGSPPGFQALSLSMLAFRMEAHGRVVALVVAGLCGGLLLSGGELLSLVPKMVLGGILVYLGLAFLAEWVFDAWFQLPRLDYALIVAILAMIVAVGLLQGVVLGLVIAVILFVVSYSTIDVVKHALSGASARSRVTRGPHQRQTLSEHAEEIFVLELQGFVFFGTANSVLERVRSRMDDVRLAPLRFVILDFRRVTGLDTTALLSFAKLRQRIEAAGSALALTHLSPALRARLERGGFRDQPSGPIHFFADLDRGLEWCENEILGGAADAAEQPTLTGQLAELAPGAIGLGALLKYFERRTVERGDYLIRPGEPPDTLFFVESGQVTAQVEPADGAPIRLETMGGGRVVGELGFYLGGQRTAAVVADKPGTIYRLSLSDLQRMEQEAPEAAALLHQIVARLLAERAVHLMNTVDALQR
jgi:SulP family sulfate permease